MNRTVKASRLFIFIISQSQNGVCVGCRAVLMPLEDALDGFAGRS